MENIAHALFCLGIVRISVHVSSFGLGATGRVGKHRAGNATFKFLPRDAPERRRWIHAVAIFIRHSVAGKRPAPF